MSAGGGPGRVRIELIATRRPDRLRRRRRLWNKPRFKFDDGGLFQLGDLLDDGLGAVLVLLILLLALIPIVIYVGPIVVGFVVAFVELVLVGLLGLIGWVWAWLRRHPQVAILTYGEERWRRQLSPEDSIAEDRQMLEAGAAPESLGYRPDAAAA